MLVEHAQHHEDDARDGKQDDGDDQEDLPDGSVDLIDFLAELQSVDALLEVVAGLVHLTKRHGALRGHGLGVGERLLEGLGRLFREFIGVQGLGLGDERRELGAVGLDVLDVDGQLFRIVRLDDAVAGFDEFLPAFDAVHMLAGSGERGRADHAAAGILEPFGRGALEDGGIVFVGRQVDGVSAGVQGVLDEVPRGAFGGAVHEIGRDVADGCAGVVDEDLDVVGRGGAAQDDDVTGVQALRDIVDGLGILEPVRDVEHDRVAGELEGVVQAGDRFLGRLLAAAVAVPQVKVVLQFFKSVGRDLALAGLAGGAVDQHAVDGGVFQEDKTLVLGLLDRDRDDVHAVFHAVAETRQRVFRIETGIARLGCAQDTAVIVVVARDDLVDGARLILFLVFSALRGGAGDGFVRGVLGRRDTRRGRRCFHRLILRRGKGRDRKADCHDESDEDCQ